MFGYTQDAKGDKSAARLISLIGCWTAVGTVLIGSSLAFFELFKDTKTSNGVQIILAGLAIFTGGSLLKWASKKDEKETETLLTEAEIRLEEKTNGSGSSSPTA
jgi:hypothetical protein